MLPHGTGRRPAGAYQHGLRAVLQPRRRQLASGSIDKTIRFWDAKTQEPLEIIPLGSIVYSVAFSPDGTRLAAGCRDNTIRLIDVAHRQQVAELRGHTDYVHAVAWSPDGTRTGLRLRRYDGAHLGFAVGAGAGEEGEGGSRVGRGVAIEGVRRTVSPPVR